MAMRLATRGAAWGIFRDVGAYGWRYPGICSKNVGDWIVGRFHEIAEEKGVHVMWNPAMAEVWVDAEEPEHDYAGWREQAMQEADAFAGASQPPQGWFADEVSYSE